MASDLVSDYIVFYPQWGAIPQPAAGGPSEIFNIIGWFQANGYGAPPEGQKSVAMHAPHNNQNNVVDFPKGTVWDSNTQSQYTYGEADLDEHTVLAFRIYPLYLPDYFAGDDFQYKVTVNGHLVVKATTLYDTKPGNTCYRSVHEVLPGKVKGKDPKTGEEIDVPLWKPTGNKVVFEHVKGKGGVSISDVVLFYKRRVTFATELDLRGIRDSIYNIYQELGDVKNQSADTAGAAGGQMKIKPPWPGRPESESDDLPPPK